MVQVPRVPHIGIFMPDEIQMLRNIVHQAVGGKWASPRWHDISLGVAKRIFEAYTNGAMNSEELLRLGVIEKFRLKGQHVVDGSRANSSKRLMALRGAAPTNAGEAMAPAD